jgi:hypothetical protein
MSHVGNKSVIVDVEYISGVTDEDQWQIVRISSSEQFRRIVEHFPTGYEESTVSEKGLDPIHFVERSDAEGNRSEPERLLSMTSGILGSIFTQNEHEGSGRETTEYGDSVIAKDFFETTELSVEGDRALEVGYRNQGGTNCPRLCGALTRHVLPPSTCSKATIATHHHLRRWSPLAPHFFSL